MERIGKPIKKQAIFLAVQCDAFAPGTAEPVFSDH
jgi:hypothetical protein